MLPPERALPCRKYNYIRMFSYFIFCIFLFSTIIEEPESPATRQKSATNNISVQKIVHSSKTINSNNVTSQINNNQNSIQASLSSTNSNLTVPATTTTPISTKVQTKSNQSNQRTVLKSKRILNTRTEVKENILNKVQEDLNNVKHSTPKQSTSSSVRTSPNILENLNLNEHLAYKEYKEAGEYWK